MKNISKRGAMAVLGLYALFMALGTGAVAQGDQSEGELQKCLRIIMNDGTAKVGNLVALNVDDVVLEIDGLGNVKFPKYVIQQIQELTDEECEIAKQIDKPMRQFDLNPQASRYFFSPSAIPMEEGEGYFQTIGIHNSASFGLSDEFTAGAMMNLLGAGLTAKYGWKLGDRVHVSLGGLVFTDFYGELDQPLALGFVNVTMGDENKNLTFNIGLGNKTDVDSYPTTFAYDSSNYQYHITEEHVVTSRPILFNVSGMSQINESAWFITENYLIVERRDEYLRSVSRWSYYGLDYYPDNEAREIAIFSFGLRKINRRSGWIMDLAMGAVYDGYDWYPVPWATWTLPF